MDKYVYLLNRASNKTAYRERPVETLKKVEKLKYNVEKKEEEQQKQDKEVYNSSNTRRKRISQAIKKVNDKAFKEAVRIGVGNKLNDLLYQKQVLINSKAPIKDIEEINKRIADEISLQTREQDLLKEAEQYKNEPLKYLMKLQDIKMEKDTLSQTQSNKELKEIKDILMAKLTPAERLRFSDEFIKLKPMEKKYISDKLKSVSKRDTKKRGEIVESFLNLEPEKRTEILTDLLPNEEKPPKGAITEITELKEPIVKKQIIKEVKKNSIAETHFDGDLKMKKFVKDKLMADNSVSKTEIEKNIEMYKAEYTAKLRKPYDILIENADEDAEKEVEKKEAIKDAIDNSAEEAVEDSEMPALAPAETPEEKRMIEDITAMMVDEDGTDEEIAKVDAKEAVEGAKAELNIKEPEKEPEKELEPEKEPEKEPEQQKKKRGRKPKPKETGKGFTPLHKFPYHLVAGALGRHIDRVRQKRFKQNMRTLDIHNNTNTNSREYAHKLKQHLLSGGGFGDWFFKGLTAPFRIASQIPLPGLQQIGQIGANVADSLGV